MLADGGTITKTQSAVVLEKLIGQFLFDKAATGRREMIECRDRRVALALRALRAARGCADASAPAARRPVRAVQPRDVRDPRAVDT